MGWRKQFVSCDGSLQGVVKDAMYPKNHWSFSNSYTKTKNSILLQKITIPNQNIQLQTLIIWNNSLTSLWDAKVYEWCKGAVVVFNAPKNYLGGFVQEENFA
jgi:hypothetical protein